MLIKTEMFLKLILILCTHEISGFHGYEDSGHGLLGCDIV